MCEKTCCAEIGMTLLVDKSGKLFGLGRCSLKDILVNREAKIVFMSFTGWF